MSQHRRTWSARPPARPSGRPPRRLAVALAAATAALTLTAGCASSLASGDDDAPSEGTITIQDGSFGPKLTVAPGATVTVRNEDGTVHSIDGADISVPDIQPGKSTTFTAPEKEGIYPFTDGHQAQMAGALVVAEELPSTPPPSFTETPRW